MTEPDPLQHLRDLPLPAVPEHLSARIRERAHAELRAERHPATPAGRPVARALAVAAVVALCVSHLGWTVAFLTKMHAPSAPVATRTVR
jgi:ferric-dicitrate binding protein FerR (iron transport regulator)